MNTFDMFNQNFIIIQRLKFKLIFEIPVIENYIFHFQHFLKQNQFFTHNISNMILVTKVNFPNLWKYFELQIFHDDHYYVNHFEYTIYFQ